MRTRRTSRPPNGGKRGPTRGCAASRLTPAMMWRTAMAAARGLTDARNSWSRTRSERALVVQRSATLAASLALRRVEGSGPGLDFGVVVRAACLYVSQCLEGEKPPLLLQRDIGSDRFLDDPSLGTVEPLGKAIELLGEVDGQVAGDDAGGHVHQV